MMLLDKKKMAGLIAGGMNGQLKEKQMNENGGESDMELGLQSAAQDIVRFTQDKNPEGVKSALESFISMVLDQRDMGESEEHE